MFSDTEQSSRPHTATKLIVRTSRIFFVPSIFPKKLTLGPVDKISKRSHVLKSIFPKNIEKHEKTQTSREQQEEEKGKSQEKKHFFSKLFGTFLDTCGTSF